MVALIRGVVKFSDGFVGEVDRGGGLGWRSKQEGLREACHSLVNCAGATSGRTISMTSRI